MLVDNVEGFELLTSHEAIKRCQREAGVCCESMELDLGTLGRVPVQVPRSIAFDELDEDEAHVLFAGICDHIDRTYGEAMTADARGDYLTMTRR